MKSFKHFITEKPQAMKGREKGTAYFSSGETVGGKTPEEAVSSAEQEAKRRAAEEAKRRKADLTPRKSGRNKDVLDAADDATRAGSNTPGRGSSGRSGASILDDLLGKPPASDIRPGPRSSKPTAVKQSDVSVKAKDYRKKFARGAQGPSTKLRTPAQTKKYQTGVKKGYFDPRSGRVSEKGIQKHVNMRTVGGENFGRMKGADPRGELAKVSNIVSRAAGGDKAARSEVKRSYKSITKNYSPETGARTNPATKKSFKIFQQQVSSAGTPKLEPTKKMPIPSAPSTGSSSGSSTQTATKTKTKTPTLNLGTPPKTTSAPTKGGELATGTKPGQLVAPSKPAATSSPSRQTTYTGIGGGKKVEVAGSSKPSSATTNLLPPGQTQTGKPPKRREVKIPKPLAPKRSQVVKNVETSLSGAKQAYPKNSTGARNLVGLKRGGRLLGRALGPAMTAWDAYDSYKAERERGQTKERATKAAIATAGGGALGAWGGAKAGAALGGAIGSIVPGAGTAIGAGIGGLVGGIGGYMAGSGAGKALLGAIKKDKEWMRMTNRKNQAGTSATATTFKSGNKGIVRDASGKERVGYAAVKDGKTVYKTANDPKSLKYTSSNPLERLGRSTADAGIPFVSDFLKNRYAKSDEAARKRKVAAVKAAATNK